MVYPAPHPETELPIMPDLRNAMLATVAVLGRSLATLPFAVVACGHTHNGSYGTVRRHADIHRSSQQ